MPRFRWCVTSLRLVLAVILLTSLGGVSLAAATPEPATRPAAAGDLAPLAYPNPGLVTGDVDVHDPSMMRAADGTYLLFSTGTNLEMRTSTDRIAFRRTGSVFPNGASWTDPFTGGSRVLWAPDISYRNGRYHLYYSASTFGSRNSAIFLATSATAQPGSWTNHGIVVQSGNSSTHNAIDPNLVVDQSGNWWLAYGSFWSGIAMIRLDPATGRQHPTDTARRSVAARPNASGALEAANIVYRQGYYYLFVSFDYCCRGTASTYRVMVGRSTSVTGPYVDRAGTPMTNGGGTEILANHDAIHGPGHTTAFPDSDAWVIAYHHYPSNAGRLGINLLSWGGGWPTVY